MRKRLTEILAVLALGIVPAAAAFAQGSGDSLESRLVARRVVVAEGRESLVDAANARPGDVIDYAATYRNADKQAIKALQATIPIPPETEFMAGTARPGQAQASLDGRVFADIPLKRTVMREGRRVEVTVPSREYRYLRWTLGDLGGGQSVVVSARVRVLDDRPGGETERRTP